MVDQSASTAMNDTHSKEARRKLITHILTFTANFQGPLHMETAGRLTGNTMILISKEII